MKILHITRSDFQDSFSRAARALHQRLEKKGIQSRMLIQPRAGDEPAIEVRAGEPSAPELFPIVQRFAFDHNAASPVSSAFSLGYPGAALTDHAEVRECEVIHLHQVAHFLSPADLGNLLALGKPIVWTLQDAWPFTGGCYQPADCGEFRDGCQRCGQLRDDRFHLPSVVLEDKIAALAPSPYALLAASEWLAQAARASRVFSGVSPRRISEKRGATGSGVKRSDQQAQVSLLFIGETPGGEIRFAQQLKDLLETAQTYGGFRGLVRRGAVHLLVAGLPENALPTLDLPVQFLRFSSTASVAEALARADLLVLPGLQDLRPSLLLEAQAHGVPVVAFNHAGAAEFINGQNGRLVGPNMRAMSEMVSYLAGNPALLREMSVQCEALPPDGDDEQIVQLYQRALAEGATARPAARKSMTPALQARCEEITCEAARRYVTQHLPEENVLKQRLETAEKIVKATDSLIEDAQRSLGLIQRRQQDLLEAGTLTEPLSRRLRAAQKSTASLRNKLKWRARRIKVFEISEAGKGPAEQNAQPRPKPPKISPVLQLVYSVVGKNYWMKHGKKDQYPPRPVVYPEFPASKLREDRWPSIAIVTPSYMQGDYLEATLRSVLEQDYPKLNYAVQDGGSSDRSIEVLHAYAARLKTWASQPDSGQTRAILSGFEKVSGQIMGWLNSDDLFVPGALRFVGEYFATHPKVDAIYGNRILINEHGQEVARWILPPHQAEITRFVDQVPQETLFWRAALWDKVGGLDPSFRFAMDWDLILRFQKAGACIKHVPHFLGCFRVHSQQKTSAQMESLGAEETAYLRRREHGRSFTHEDLLPYKQWLEVHSALRARLQEFGLRS